MIEHQFMRKKLLLFTYLFLITAMTTVFGQTHNEVESNNTLATTLNSAQSRIYGPGKITGTVAPTDSDFWIISRNTNQSANLDLYLDRAYVSNNYQLDFRIWEYRGGNWGVTPTNIGNMRTLVSPSGVYNYKFTLPYANNLNGAGVSNNYYAIEVFTTATSAKSYAFDFGANSSTFNYCYATATPSGATVSPVNDTDVAITSITGGSNDGYIVKISKTNSFTNYTNHYIQNKAIPTAAGSNTYASGEHIAYVGNRAGVTTANTKMAGLTRNTTYYYKIYTYKNCHGYVNYNNTFTPVAVTTCSGNAPNSASINAVDATSATSATIASLNRPAGATSSTGYLVKFSDENGFTAPTSGFTLPTASTDYTGKSGEMVAYTGAIGSGAGTVDNINTVITGLQMNKMYYAKVYAYNLCGGKYNFESTGSAVKSITYECKAPGVATNVVANGSGPTTLQIVSYTAPANPANGAVGYIVKVNKTNSFTAPTSVPTSANTVYGSGEQVVYVGSSVSPNVTVTGLTENNQYYVKVYTYNTCGGANFFDATGSAVVTVTSCGAPTGATKLTFRQDLDREFRLSPVLNNVPSGATGHVVKINTADSFTPITGVQNSIPTANTQYSGSGEQVFFAGNSGEGHAFTAYNLVANTVYYFRVYTYKECGGKYYFSATSNGATRASLGVTDKLASNAVVKNFTGTSVLFESFTAAPTLDNGLGKAKGYIIKMNTTNSFTAYNHRENLPPANTVYGGGEQVVYSKMLYNEVPPSTTPNITITGLTPGTTYYFSVFAVSHGGAPYFHTSFQKNGYEFSIVNKKQVTITLKASDLNQTYDGTAKPVTIDSVVETVGGAPASPAPTINMSYQGVDVTYGPSATAPTNAGTYKVTATVAANDANYSGNIEKNLVIAKRAITVTADALTKVYGAADNLTYKITTGTLVNSNDLTGSLARVTGENVGTYAINQGTLNSPNYAITYVGNDLTITKHAISVKADDKSKGEGNTDPTLTYQITTGSLAFSDAFTGALTRATGETQGVYPITQGTLVLNDNYDITFTGGNFTITAPIPATALHFQGNVDQNYDYVEVADHASLDFTTAYTVETWVNFDLIKRANDGWDWACLFAKSRYNESYALMLLIDPGHANILRFYHAGFGNGYTDYTWSGLTTNTWYHVAVTLSSTKTAIFINGTEVASQTATGSLTPNNKPLVIGANKSTGVDPYPLNGKLDEFRVWNTAKTQVEIAANMNYELQGNEAGLVLNYRFNQGFVGANNSAITTVTDNGPGGLNGTLKQFALNGGVSNFVAGSPNVLKLQVKLSSKAFLQGATINPTSGEEALMRDNLRQASVIPTTSPYSDNATCSASVFTATGANAIVDWVWLELRDATDKTKVLHAQSALIQRDGDIVAADGTSVVTVKAKPNKNYFLAISHRNHLGILTKTAIQMGTGTTVVDLSSDSANVNGGTNAVATMGSKIALIAGDFDGNKQIQTTDVNGVRATLGVSGYNKADFDMNGQIQTIDINNVINPNLGKGQQF